jgi:hypothetical protein
MSTDEQGTAAKESQPAKPSSRGLLGSMLVALLSSCLSVSATLWITSYFKPNLTVDYAWGFGVTEPITDETNAFFTGLLDLYHSTPTFFRNTGWEIRFPSSRDYKFVRKDQSYIGILSIRNTGQATAKAIRIGLKFLFPAQDLKVFGSPNVSASVQAHIESVAPNPAVAVVSLDRLPPKDRAGVKLQWAHRAPVRNAFGDEFHADRYYLPTIIFITSDEGVGKVDRFVSIDDLVQEDLTDFVGGPTPLWAVNLIPVHGGTKMYWKRADMSKFEYKGVVENAGRNPSALPASSEYVPEDSKRK